MKPFFNDVAKRFELQKAAVSWLGTPFHGHANIRGKGVDCVHLAANLYIAAGLIDQFNPPVYALDGGVHSEMSAVEAFVNGTGKFEKLSAGTASVFGDLLCIRMGRVSHHVGIRMYGTLFMHVYQGQVAGMCNVDDPTWSSRIVSVYRPMTS